MHALRLGLLVVVAAALLLLLETASDRLGVAASHPPRSSRATPRTRFVPAPRRPPVRPSQVPPPKRLADLLAEQRKRELNTDRQLRQQQMVRWKTLELQRRLAATPARRRSA